MQIKAITATINGNKTILKHLFLFYYLFYSILIKSGLKLLSPKPVLANSRQIKMLWILYRLVKLT